MANLGWVYQMGLINLPEIHLIILYINEKFHCSKCKEYTKMENRILSYI